MKTHKQQEKNTLQAGKSQQLELPVGVSYLIREDEPVRLLWEVLEEINFTAYEKETAEEAGELEKKRRGEMTLQGIQAVSGKGRRKHPLQREAEQLEALWAKWEEYKTKLDIIGPGRNSYAKTDHAAIFMRMKDDHMRNGLLKPVYNVQLAVNSEYIVGYGVFSDRTDSGTLKPMLQTMEEQHGRKCGSITADAGYESLENYTYLDENNQQSFIKPANYEQRKKKGNWIGAWRRWATTPTQTPLPAKTVNSSPLPTKENKKAAPVLRVNIPCIGVLNVPVTLCVRSV